MNESINKVAKRMKQYHHADPAKVQRFVRVYTLSKTIGELEHLPEQTQENLELSALMHAVAGEDKTAVITQILSECSLDDEVIERVCYIVENRHNYDHVSGLDHQILIEAEMIVDFKEHDTPEKEIIRLAEERFITNYGKLMLKRAFGI